jgi:hypothetical protein
MYANRSRETLWWRIAVNHLPLKRVVRSWCARRVRRAFRQALNERGYDPGGRRIGLDVSDAQGTRLEQVRPEAGLRGTAEVIVLKSLVNQSFPAVQQELTMLVDALLRVAK